VPDAHPDLQTKAAALLQSIVNNHALVDGTKRLGWLATALFLELNRIKASRVSNDDVYELVIWIAASNPDLDEITTRLRRVVQPRTEARLTTAR
jgi:death-on-curing protein